MLKSSITTSVLISTSSLTNPNALISAETTVRLAPTSLKFIMRSPETLPQTSISKTILKKTKLLPLLTHIDLTVMRAIAETLTINAEAMDVIMVMATIMGVAAAEVVAAVEVMAATEVVAAATEAVAAAAAVEDYTEAEDTVEDTVAMAMAAEDMAAVEEDSTVVVVVVEDTVAATVAA
jgi:hypothetical protein